MSVELNIAGPVAQVSLNRPEKHNAFDDRTIASLTDTLARAAAEPAVRVIVLRAEGKHFSAGADLAWMRAMGALGVQENRDDALRLAGLMRAIDQCAKPVVARVQGAAYGGALGLICAADMAVCTEDARFCLSEVKLGILPAVIAPYVVRAMGQRQARRYFMSAEVFDASTARRLGVVHEVAPLAELDDRVRTLVEALLAGAPGAQREARALIERTDGPIDEAMITHTAELIARLRTGDEGQEGLSAFLEKRSAAWKNNS